MMTNYLFITEMKKAIDYTESLSLRNLYLPVIGHESITFYNYLVDHDYICNGSSGMTSFEEASKHTRLSMYEISDAKKRLEAVGLLRTFESSDGKKLIFTILPPLTPEKIKSNPILYRRVVSIIGEVQFERVFFITKNKEFSKNDFKETTTKYHEVFNLAEQQLEAQKAKNNTLTMPMKSIKNIDEAISGLTAIQFVKYLTEKEASPSQIQMIQRLISNGLASEAINYVIKYSYDLNGKIVSNHIETIGNDFIKKGMFRSIEVQTELDNAKESKNRAGFNPFFDDNTVEVSKQTVETAAKENQSESKWNELFNSLGGDL